MEQMVHPKKILGDLACEKSFGDFCLFGFRFKFSSFALSFQFLTSCTYPFACKEIRIKILTTVFFKNSTYFATHLLPKRTGHPE